MSVFLQSPRTVKSREEEERLQPKPRPPLPPPPQTFSLFPSSPHFVNLSHHHLLPTPPPLTFRLDQLPFITATSLFCPLPQPLLPAGMHPTFGPHHTPSPYTSYSLHAFIPFIFFPTRLHIFCLSPHVHFPFVLFCSSP
jgi:hypothetical protein